MLYPLALMFHKHPAGPQMAARMVVKVQAKDKQYKGVHRQAEQDLKRSELLLFILMACYYLNNAALYILMLLTMSLLGKTGLTSNMKIYNHGNVFMSLIFAL